jgi:uncharacterized protein (DUF305 family)
MKIQNFRNSAVALALGLAVVGFTPALASAADQDRMNGVPESTDLTSQTSKDGVPRNGHTMDHDRMECSHGATGMSRTGNADYDFAANMKMHHQMGIQMAKTQIKNGKNPEMLKMAKTIVANQTKEAAALDTYLAANKSIKLNGVTLSE